MGRRETELNPQATALEQFAHDLRALRRTAGSPSYRELARTAHYSASALSTAANGRALPSLPVLEAYVRACGGDAQQWRQRWEELSGKQTPPQGDRGGEPPTTADPFEAAAPSDAPPAPRNPPGIAPWPRYRRRLLTIGPLAMTVAVAVATSVVAAMNPGHGDLTPAAAPTAKSNAYPPGKACDPAEGEGDVVPVSAGPEADSPTEQGGTIDFATSTTANHLWGNWWHPANVIETVSTEDPYLGKSTLRVEVTPGFTAIGSIHMPGLDARDTVAVHIWYGGQGEATICPFVQQAKTFHTYWPQVHELDLTPHSTPGWRTYQWKIPDMAVRGTGLQINNTGVTDVVFALGAVSW
jgi:hypothetical protein